MMILPIGRRLASREPSRADDRPDWVQASPARIERMLARALSRPSGGWYVLDASRAIDTTPRRYVIDGRELVAYRSEGRAYVAPDECPHMGAALSCGRVEAGRLVCPWHGLSLGPEGHGRWRPLPAHDDGVLVWARLDGAEAPTDRPILPERPATFVDAVVRMEGACAPEDVVANRLDPWHGAHFHPHSFARLRVLEEDDDRIVLRVAYRALGPLCVEVDAMFHSPEPRSIVMTIVGGDGAGSVVETHATPIADGRSAVVEATLATSDRPGFAVAMRAARVLRPFMERRAARLWAEDLAYAERRYALRTRDAASGGRRPLAVIRAIP